MNTLFEFEITRAQVAEYFPDEAEAKEEGDAQPIIRISTDNIRGKKTVAALRLQFWHIGTDGRGESCLMTTIMDAPKIPLLKPILETHRDCKKEFLASTLAWLAEQADEIPARVKMLDFDHPYTAAARHYCASLGVIPVGR